MTGLGGGSDERGFEAFFARWEPVIRRVLVAGFGPELGRDAAGEAFGWAWSTWPRIESMNNPSGYLYRVGSNWAKRQLSFERRERETAWSTIPREAAGAGLVEPGLVPALTSLTRRQFEVVTLVAGHGFSHAEAAQLLGIARSSVQNHLERGLAKLRSSLGVEIDAR